MADAKADTCYLVDPPVYEDTASALTVQALTQLEWALLLLGREPGEPPFRGDPVDALKRAITLTREALKETR